MSTYYVSQLSGSNSNDGSQAHPWLTLARAKAGASSGDTVNIVDGTFDENDWWKDGVTWYGPTANIGYTGGGTLFLSDNQNMRTTIVLNNIYVYGGDTMFVFTDNTGHTNNIRILCNDLYGDEATHGTAVDNTGGAHLAIFSKHRVGNGQYDVFFGSFGSLTIEAETLPHFTGDDSACIEGGGLNSLFCVDEFDNTDGTGPFNLVVTGRFGNPVRMTGAVYSEDGGTTKIVNGIFMGGSRFEMSQSSIGILVDTDASAATVINNGTMIAMGNTRMPSGFTNFIDLRYRTNTFPGEPSLISGIVQA